MEHDRDLPPGKVCFATTATGMGPTSIPKTRKITVNLSFTVAEKQRTSQEEIKSKGITQKKSESKQPRKTERSCFVSIV
jgi:hypothetical protein